MSSQPRESTPRSDATDEGRARSRIAWADTARGLAICLVVLYHATNWTAGTGYDVSVLRELNEPLRSLRMPLFFTVAGMFATKWVATSWPTLLRGKLFYFAWVFVLWEPITLVVRLVTGYYKVPGADWSTLAGDLTWSLLIPRSELWFIWTLAVFFLVARLVRPVPVWLQLVVATGVSGWALAGWEPTSIAYRGAAQFILFFLVGLHLRPLVEAYAERLRWWSGLLWVGAWYGVTWVVRTYGLEPTPGPYLLANIAGALAGIAISVALARLLPGLGWVGARTLPIYVLHTPLIHTILWVYWSNAVWVPTPQSQWMPVFMAMFIVATALTLDALTRRIGLGWLWGPPRRWLATP
ncbi:acyltransferase [Myceligenerans cantabricum]